MSATNVLITSSFATVLEKIEKTSKLRGLSGTSNASAEATETVRKLERRIATFLDTEEISQDFLSTMADAAEVCQAKVSKIVRQRRRINQLYRDIDFSLQRDMDAKSGDCLTTLDGIGA